MLKARSLADILEKYEGPLTADFQRVYGLRLTDAVVSHEESELIDLIVWLPDGSAFASMLRVDRDFKSAREIFGWDVVTDILLNQLNVSAHADYVVTSANTKANVPVPKMIRNPRARETRSDNAGAIARGMLAAQKG